MTSQTMLTVDKQRQVALVGDRANRELLVETSTAAFEAVGGAGGR